MDGLLANSIDIAGFPFNTKLAGFVVVAVELEDAGNLQSSEPATWRFGLTLFQAALENVSSYLPQAQPIASLSDHAFYLKFSGLEDALSAIFALQQEWQTQANQLSALFLRLRIVVDLENYSSLQTDLVDNGLDQLTRLNRLLSYTQGDQIIFSSAIFEQLQTELPDNLSLRDLGRRALSEEKVFLEHIYELTTTQAHSLKTNNPANYNFYDALFPSIPAEVLIREQEVVELERLLRHNGVRLVSVVGPVGSGKSRLALEVASRLSKNSFLQDGFFFITIKSPDVDNGLLVAIAEHLELEIEQDVESQLITYLQGKQTLLILANLKATPLINRQLVSLLSQTSGLTILVTSLASLQLPWEHVYNLAGSNFSLSLLSDEMETGTPANAQSSISSVYYLKLLEQAASGLRGERQNRWLDWLEEEYSVIRTLLNSYSTQLEVKPLDIEIGLRMAAALTTFWEIRGYLSEGRRLLTSLLYISDTGNNPNSKNLPAGYYSARSLALIAAGRLAYLQGSYSTAQTFFEEGLELQEELNDNFAMTFSLTHIGNLALRQGDYGSAYYHFECALGLSHRLSDSWAEADVLNGLGLCSWFQGRYSEAEELLSRSQELWEKLGDKKGLAMSNGNLGLLACSLGNYEQAALFHARSLELWQSLVDRYGIAQALHGQGYLAYKTGNFRQARTLYQESLTMRRELGDRWGLARTLNSLGVLTALDGNPDDAQTLLEETLLLRKELGDRWGIVETVIALGRLALKKGYYEEAYAYFLQGLYLACELETNHQIIRLLEGFAEIETCKNNLLDAVRLWSAACAFRQKFKLPISLDYQKRLDTFQAEQPTAWLEGQNLSMEECVKNAVKLASSNDIAKG